MLEWFKSNISYISLVFSGILFLLFLISLLWKKVPTERLFRLVAMIPSIINSAEQLFPNGNGEHKKQVCRDLVNNLADKYNISKYLKYIDIDSFIEEILTTPTKKGV